MNIKTPAVEQRPRPLDLPPRQVVEDLKSVQRMADRAGYALTFEAQTVAAFEWGMDQLRAAKLRDLLSLSEDEHAELLERFRERNRLVWGDHSVTHR